MQLKWWNSGGECLVGFARSGLNRVFEALFAKDIAAPNPTFGFVRAMPLLLAVGCLPSGHLLQKLRADLPRRLRHGEALSPAAIYKDVERVLVSKSTPPAAEPVPNSTQRKTLKRGPRSDTSKQAAQPVVMIPRLLTLPREVVSLSNVMKSLASCTAGLPSVVERHKADLSIERNGPIISEIDALLRAALDSNSTSGSRALETAQAQLADLTNKHEDVERMLLDLVHCCLDIHSSLPPMPPPPPKPVRSCFDCEKNLSGTCSKQCGAGGGGSEGVIFSDFHFFLAETSDFRVWRSERLTQAKAGCENRI